MFKFEVTKIFTWVILVLVLLITFNGYLTIKEFKELHERDLALDVAEDQQHQDMVNLFKVMHKDLQEMNALHSQMNDVLERIANEHKVVDNAKK